MRRKIDRRTSSEPLWRALVCGHWVFTTRRSSAFCHECARTHGRHESGHTKSGRPYARRRAS